MPRTPAIGQTYSAATGRSAAAVPFDSHRTSGRRLGVPWVDPRLVETVEHVLVHGVGVLRLEQLALLIGDPIPRDLAALP
jgi:hypothetical protein